MVFFSRFGTSQGTNLWLLFVVQGFSFHSSAYIIPARVSSHPHMGDRYWIGDWQWSKGWLEFPSPLPEPTEDEIEMLYRHIDEAAHDVTWEINSDRIVKAYALATHQADYDYPDRPNLAEDMGAQANWIGETQGLGSYGWS